jgi:hypothetical protein
MLFAPVLALAPRSCAPIAAAFAPIGLLAILHDSPRGCNSPREVPPREDLGRCIEPTEWPCACAGS